MLAERLSIAGTPNIVPPVCSRTGSMVFGINVSSEPAVSPLNTTSRKLEAKPSGADSTRLDKI